MPSTPSIEPRRFRGSKQHAGRFAGKAHPFSLAVALALGGVGVGSSAAPTAGQVAPQAAAAEPALPSELDALDLADKAVNTSPPVQEAKNSVWRAFVEAAAGRTTLRGNAPDVNTRRLSADLRYDQRWTPELRAVLSNRLDLADSDAAPPAQNVNTLREAYLSWTPMQSTVVDLGRVNIPLGSAMGYNPTDWFKSGALRSVVSPDPAVLRENRQGTVVLRAQRLWEGGSLTGLVSPKLASSPDAGRYALDAGATNPRDRWLLTGSQRVSDRFSPQWLLQGGNGQATQVGLNLSALAGDATTVYAEWANGRGPTLLDQGAAMAGDGKRHNRAALGLTHTTSFNLMLTIEAQTNSAAPTRSQWLALTAAERLAVLAVAQREQDLISRRAWFVHAQWKDIVVPRLDMAGYWRHDTETGSNERWLELRYRGQQWEAALQWQGFGGDTESLLGSIPEAKLLEVALRVYF